MIGLRLPTGGRYEHDYFPGLFSVITLPQQFLINI